jgi:translation initiation factor IF-2
MAKDSILDRADARLRGKSSSDESVADKGGRKAGGTVVRRRSRGGKAAEADASSNGANGAEAKATTVRRRTTVRRKAATTAPVVEVEAPAAAPVAPEEPAATPVESDPVETAPEVEASSETVVEEPKAVEVEVASEAAPEAEEPEVAAAASEDSDSDSDPGSDLPPSIDDLLSSSAERKKRVHKVLSDEQIEAEKQGKVASVTPSADVSASGEGAAAEPSEEEAEVAGDAAGASVEAAAAAAELDPNASLEDLLKEQGIVQHKPKKGRRIIEDEVSATTLAAANAAQIQAKADVPSGPSLYEKATPRNKPIRFLDPATIQREREARARRGRRKEVVSPRDNLYGGARGRNRRKGRAPAKGSGKSTEITTAAAHKRVIKVHGGITVADLANGMGIKGGMLIKTLVGMGQMVTLNEVLDVETAQLIAEDFDYQVEDVSFDEEEILQQSEDLDADEDLEARAPVVTIMGHVDHGKTSLLDLIRKSKVAEGEAGGITQHVSAFDVVAEGESITFVDTPGHAAFTAMRARGADMTDIVVLVVAATEGVMPQTVEVIAHAKAAEVPIIVAMNKMDLAEANPDKCRQQLSEQELIPEDWGGETQMIPVSAKTGEGLDSLLEAINLQAEMLELKANPKRQASGRVIEAQVEKGRGPVSIVLVQRGTLRSGDIVVAGTEFGRVRALFETGTKKPKKLKEVGPSSPVAILGLSGLPSAGDEFAVVDNDKAAKSVVEHRKDIERKKMDVKKGMSLDDVFSRMKEGEIKELNLIIKADVQGSIEALKQVLTEIEVRDTRVKIIHSGVGGVTLGDVTLAEASSAIIVGFGVRPDAKARNEADRAKVEIRTYRIIYEAVDEIKAALVGMLDPEFRETVVGHAEVRDTFKISKVGVICGSFVQDGKVSRNHKIRVLRNSVVVWEGGVKSVRRFKDDVKEVLQGYECGIGLDGYDDVKEGDILETFIIEEIRPTV